MVFPIIYFTPSLDYSCLQFASTKIKMRKFRCVFMTYPESAKRLLGKDMTPPAIPPSRHPFPPFQLRRGDVLIFVPGAYECLGLQVAGGIDTSMSIWKRKKKSSQLFKGDNHTYIYICMYMDTLTSLEGRCWLLFLHFFVTKL